MIRRAIYSLMAAGVVSATAAGTANEGAAKQVVPVTTFIYREVPDTVYVLGNLYLEVSLEEQYVRAWFRDGSKLEFPVSSGSKFVSKGIETPSGIYTVQSKNPMAISKQFENAKLHWWIGIHGNIGFHGLDGNGYYRHLGRRPSSHGCLRMAREDIKELFAAVKIGVPVLVYKERPARVLAFADTTDARIWNAEVLASMNAEQRGLMEQRLKNIYAGRAWENSHRMVVMDGTKMKRGGYDVGLAELMPLRQERNMNAIASYAQPMPRDRFAIHRRMFPAERRDTAAATRGSVLPDS